MSQVYMYSDRPSLIVSIFLPIESHEDPSDVFLLGQIGTRRDQLFQRSCQRPDSPIQPSPCCESVTKCAALKANGAGIILSCGARSSKEVLISIDADHKRVSVENILD